MKCSIGLVIVVSLFLAVISGCSQDSTPPKSTRTSNSGDPPPTQVTETDHQEQTLPELLGEMKALVTGAATLDRNEHLRSRAAYLQDRIEARGHTFPDLDPNAVDWPSGRAWPIPDSIESREQCLGLHAELEALAIGRGYVSGDATRSIQDRIDYLRKRLLDAGYDFDDVGYENRWNDDGSAREGYVPLTD